MKFLELAIGAALLGGGAYLALKEGTSHSAIAPGTFKIANDRYRFEYAIDQSETVLTGALTMTGDQAGVSEGGATKTLHYLSNEDASDFKANHGAGECPAPYFNAHAKQRILIPANDDVAKQISRINFDDYRDSSKWRHFSIAGYCIRKAALVEKDGKPATMPTNMFDNCRTMVVKHMSVSEQ